MLIPEQLIPCPELTGASEPLTAPCAAPADRACMFRAHGESNSVTPTTPPTTPPTPGCLRQRQSETFCAVQVRDHETKLSSYNHFLFEVNPYCTEAEGKRCQQAGSSWESEVTEWENALFSPVREWNKWKNWHIQDPPAGEHSRCLRCLIPQSLSPLGILTAANSNHVANAHVEYNQTTRKPQGEQSQIHPKPVTSEWTS